MTTQPATVAPSNLPDKVTTLLADATASGLTVTRENNHGDIQCWTISSANPIDSTQVWLYWTPGQRGGRLSITVYYGARARRNVTRRYARIALNDMAESLQRHQARVEARCAEGNHAQCSTGHCSALRSQSVNPATAPRFTMEQARAAMAQVGRELNANAARISKAMEAAFTPKPDPARPGWFMVGQVVLERHSDLTYQVLDIEAGGSGVTGVLVSTKGGYGKPRWFGDHPYAEAPLSALEGPHIGRPENTMRAWPKSVYSAIEATKLTLHDQRLSGYVLANPSGPGIVVNLPRDTDPERHLILLQRYMPYPCHVGIHQVSPPSEGRYCTLLITPKEG